MLIARSRAVVDNDQMTRWLAYAAGFALMVAGALVPLPTVIRVVCFIVGVLLLFGHHYVSIKRASERGEIDTLYDGA
jgi:hypothetical protein